MRGPWHAILLDVDNGPDAFTSPANAKLYGVKGLRLRVIALVHGGALGVWSVENDNGFTDRLTAAGFEVDRQNVPSRPGSTVKHVIWIAQEALAALLARPVGELVRTRGRTSSARLRCRRCSRPCRTTRASAPCPRCSGARPRSAPARTSSFLPSASQRIAAASGIVTASPAMSISAPFSSFALRERERAELADVLDRDHLQLRRRLVARASACRRSASTARASSP